MPRVRVWFIGAATSLLACATPPATLRPQAPTPWTLDRLVAAARQHDEPGAAAALGRAAFSASAPPSPWQAGFTLPTDPDRMLRPMANLLHIKAQNALVIRQLEAFWRARTRIRDALVDYCAARELASFTPPADHQVESRLAALAGAAFVPLGTLQAGLVPCAEFASLPAPVDEATLLRAARARRTDYLAALENYLFQKSLWHRRRGAPQQPAAATLQIAFLAGEENYQPDPATLELVLRHRMLVSEVRDYAGEYRTVYHAAATAATGAAGAARVRAWYLAQRALTPLEDATRAVLVAAPGLARPW